MPRSGSYGVIRRPGTEPPEFTRLACSRVPLAHPRRLGTRPGGYPVRAASGRDRRGRARRGGEVGPNPVCLHPSPEAAQHHAQLLALAPLAAPLWPADESLGDVRRTVLVERRDPISPRMASAS